MFSQELFGIREARTRLDPSTLADPMFRFLLQLHLGTGRYRVDGRPVPASSQIMGSRAEFSAGEPVVRYDGTHNPWQTVERTHRMWTDLGRPETTDLGLTSHPARTTSGTTPDSTWTHPST